MGRACYPRPAFGRRRRQRKRHARAVTHRDDVHGAGVAAPRWPGRLSTATHATIGSCSSRKATAGLPSPKPPAGTAAQSVPPSEGHRAPATSRRARVAAASRETSRGGRCRSAQGHPTAGATAFRRCRRRSCRSTFRLPAARSAHGKSECGCWGCRHHRRRWEGARASASSPSRPTGRSGSRQAW